MHFVWVYWLQASQHTAFYSNVTSSEHTAHGKCSVGPELDSMSPHGPMMILAMWRRESLPYGRSGFWSHCILMLMEMLAAWRWLTVRGLLSVVCWCQQGWSFLAVSGFWDWIWAWLFVAVHANCLLVWYLLWCIPTYLEWLHGSWVGARWSSTRDLLWWGLRLTGWTF